MTTTAPGNQRGAGPAPPRRRFLRRFAWTAAGLTGVLLAAGATGGLWLRHALVESLPQLDGERHVAGLQAPVSVVRDGLGIPTLHGESRGDVTTPIFPRSAWVRLFT